MKPPVAHLSPIAIGENGAGLGEPFQWFALEHLVDGGAERGGKFHGVSSAAPRRPFVAENGHQEEI